MEGFGAVEVDPDEPLFREPWEARTFALAGGALAAGGFNTPMFRHAIERMEPGHYLTSSYYEHWLTAAATLLVEAGTLAPAELDARAGGFPLSHPAAAGAGDVDAVTPNETPRFGVGDAVRVRNVQFAGHTRCPRYVRGRQGVVARVDPAAPIPEVEAHRRERVLDPNYCVRFDAAELWSEASEPNSSVWVDLYEQYLEPA
jgi:nitrile hydratase